MKENNGANFGRPLLLVPLSVVLASSIIMGPLTPLPIALGTLLYGRSKGPILGGVGLLLILLLFVLLLKSSAGPFIFSVYFVSCLIAALIAEIIFRDISPIRGLVKSGLIIFFTLSLVVGSFLASSGSSLRDLVYSSAKVWSAEILKQKSQLAKKGTVEEEQFIDFLTKPELVTKEVMRVLPLVPGMVFIGIFFVLWMNLMLLLKSNRIYKIRSGHNYSDSDLINFKMPEHFVWPLMVSLLCVILGPALIGEILPVIGGNVLRCLGVFYFFQGFGIYIAFLDYIKIEGFIRSFLVLFTIFTGMWMIALVGLFDMWINFRKFFIRKGKNENEDKGE